MKNTWRSFARMRSILTTGKIIKQNCRFFFSTNKWDFFKVFEEIVTQTMTYMCMHVLSLCSFVFFNLFFFLHLREILFRRKNEIISCDYIALIYIGIRNRRVRYAYWMNEFRESRLCTILTKIKFNRASDIWPINHRAYRMS